MPRLLSTLAFAALLAGCAAPHHEPEPTVLAMPAPPPIEVGADATVLDRLIAEGEFHRFIALAQRTGHFVALRDDAGLIVLAPTDAAFAGMSPSDYLALLEDRDRLHRLLEAHVLHRQPDPRPLAALDRTLIARRDLRCTNGTVLVLDHLRPPTQGVTEQWQSGTAEHAE